MDLYDILESVHSSKMESLYGKYSQYCLQFTEEIPKRFISGDELLTFIRNIESFEKEFQLNENISQQLYSHGKPNTLMRLEKILDEIRMVKNTFIQSYRDRLNSEKNDNKIILDSRKYADNIIKGQIETEKENNDMINRLFGSFITGKCPHCGAILDEYYYRLNRCPGCKKDLHRL